jgi:integrase-like protein/DDE family transposase
LPTILTVDEVTRLIDAARTLTDRTMLMVLYSTGMRNAEMRSLHVKDIDSRAMLIHIQRGKGGRDRYVPLSPTLLETLRAYWRWMKPKTWLFPGTITGWRADKPITPKVVWDASRACDTGTSSSRKTPEARAAVYRNRRRIRGARGLRLLRLRGERLERPFAHLYETGGMRRFHLRGHTNIQKRLLIHTAGFNLELLMRQLIGVGTPRGLQGRLIAAMATLLALTRALWERVTPHRCLERHISPLERHAIVESAVGPHRRARYGFHHGLLTGDQRWSGGRLLHRSCRSFAVVQAE